jgi:hypothetical protein
MRRTQRSAKKLASRTAQPLIKLVANRADLLKRHVDRIQKLIMLSEDGAILTGIDFGRRMDESETQKTAQLLTLAYLLGKACAKELDLAKHEGSTLTELKGVVAGVLKSIEDDELMRYMGQLIRDGLVGRSERGIYVINYLRLSEILDLLEWIAGEW